MEIKPATAKQLSAIHALLHKQGLLRHKAEIIEGFTNGRTGSSKGLHLHEAADLLSHLMATEKDKNVSSKLMKKLFAMAFEMGWCPEQEYVQPDGTITKKKNYDRLHGWVLKYGYLKKPLRQYTYNELPKLVSVFEINIYNPYIQSLNKTTTAQDQQDSKKASPF